VAVADQTIAGSPGQQASGISHVGRTAGTPGRLRSGRFGGHAHHSTEALLPPVNRYGDEPAWVMV
jgi:hypothetical protein